MDIKEFYKNHIVDEDFDHVLYQQEHPEAEAFYQPYCKENNIDDKHRLYYHWYMYLKNSDSVCNYSIKHGKYYKPPEKFIDCDISVVLGCMDREKMLSISVHSWLHYDQIKEIIITDWSSKKNLQYLESLDPRIQVIRIEGHKYYNASTPVNIAIKQSKCPIIMKLDTDYIINPYANFNDLIDINENQFITGNWRDYNLDNNLGFVRGCNGFLCIYKKNIESVGYYDESIENYGVEDCDLFKRLVEYGFERKTLQFNLSNIPIYHNPHSSYYRVKNFEQKDELYNHKKYGEIVIPKK